MLSNSTPTENDGLAALPQPDRQNDPNASKQMAEYAAITRNNVIVRVSALTDPVQIAHFIDHAIELAVAAATSDPDFFDRTALMARYGKSRKWVERLPIRALQLQGAWLYRREDVLTYEASCEVNDKIIK